MKKKGALSFSWNVILALLAALLLAIAIAIILKNLKDNLFRGVL